jgi:hypothetical protein
MSVCLLYVQCVGRQDCRDRISRSSGAHRSRCLGRRTFDVHLRGRFKAEGTEPSNDIRASHSAAERSFHSFQ